MEVKMPPAFTNDFFSVKKFFMNKAFTVRIGEQYIQVLKQLRWEDNIYEREIVEMGIACYLHKLHIFKNSLEKHEMCRGIPEPVAPLKPKKWKAPESLPATVAELGPMPVPRLDPAGAREWRAAKKGIEFKIKAMEAMRAKGAARKAAEAAEDHERQTVPVWPIQERPKAVSAVSTLPATPNAPELVEV